MEPIRACPICPNCGSKRFKRLPGDTVTVQCRGCNKIIPI